MTSKAYGKFVASLFLAAMVVACGGGAGHAGIDAVAGPVVSPAASAPTPVGNLWYASSAFGLRGTARVHPVTGEAKAIWQEGEAVPWPDGRQYLTKSYDALKDVTQVSVRSVGQGQVVLERVVDGHLAEVRPAPGIASQVLLRWGESAVSARTVLVYDLSLQKVLFSQREGDAVESYDWLPDATLIRVAASGELTRLVPGLDGAQTLGRVLWPEGRQPAQVRVSPDGAHLLVRLKAPGTPGWSDYWLVKTDGTEMQRLTDNGAISKAWWSPDGRHLAFEKDTGLGCTAGGGFCFGSCELRIVSWQDLKARGPRAMDWTQGALKVQTPEGRLPMGCGVLAWTP